MTSSRVVTLDSAGSLRCAQSARRVSPPAEWALLPAGDAALTRRVKGEGAHWVVQEQRGRRTFTRGVYAPRARIERLRQALEAERATPAYARRLAASRERRARAQDAYVHEFQDAVEDFLDFAPAYRALGRALAQAVAAHATPVGSGTVARTQRIPVERRAESAVIAWLRHQTTDYDRMAIPRGKGERRAVRRRLAKRARTLLARYRKGEAVDPEACPLRRALGEPEPAPAATPPAAPKLLGLPSLRGAAAPESAPAKAPVARPSRQASAGTSPRLWERGLAR